MSTWFITRTSSGLGRALAEQAAAQGQNVVATARDIASLDGLGAGASNVLLQALDVTVPEQVPAAVRAATERFGGRDVLVNNAGYGYRAAVEEGEEDRVEMLFATNFFGPVALIKEVLPQMRSRRTGAIVNLSSIGARVMPPGSGYYAAAKAAIEALSGSLRKELAPLGIKVMTVEPGFFRTDFTGRSLVESETIIEDYAETAGKRRKVNDTTRFDSRTCATRKRRPRVRRRNPMWAKCGQSPGTTPAGKQKNADQNRVLEWLRRASIP